MEAKTKKPHHGQNIRKIRGIVDKSQDQLAELLGPGWTQQKISLLEDKELIDVPMLEQVAKALKVNVEALSSLNDDTVSNFFNSFHDNSINNGPLNNYHCTFNPIDKIVELVEEIKKVNAALIKEKDERIALLERTLKEKS